LLNDLFLSERDFAKRFGMVRNNEGCYGEFRQAENILQQTFFRSYPEEFLAVRDSGKGRER